MLNLSIKTTLTVTSNELEIICDPPLTLETVGTVDPRTSRELSEWYNNKFPVGKAVDFVPKLFLSIAQNGTAYPLTTDEDARELQDAVGEKFVSRLVLSYWNYQANYFEKKQSASVNLSDQSTNGSNPEPTP